MNAIIKALNKLGYTTCNTEIYSYIDDWQDWYKGKVDKFHNYSVYNGVKFVSCERLSLGMAKKICEDKADLLLNEKVSINVDDEATQEVIETVLDNNNFWVSANNLVELSNALGTGAFVQYIEDNETRIDYVKADMIYPLSWYNGEIKECAFGSEQLINGKTYTYLNIHVLQNGTYTIKNKMFIAEDDELSDEDKIVVARARKMQKTPNATHLIAPRSPAMNT